MVERGGQASASFVPGSPLPAWETVSPRVSSSIAAAFALRGPEA
jgi:hypothetical protein